MLIDENSNEYNCGENFKILRIAVRSYYQKTVLSAFSRLHFVLVSCDIAEYPFDRLYLSEFAFYAASNRNLVQSYSQLLACS